MNKRGIFEKKSLDFSLFVLVKDAQLLLICGTVFFEFFQEMGVVRYIGRVEFATGIWVGLELRSPKGKHDGVVEGKRYFQTKPNHGVVIRPRKISVHGINGDDLLKPEEEYPFWRKYSKTRIYDTLKLKIRVLRLCSQIKWLQTNTRILVVKKMRTQN